MSSLSKASKGIVKALMKNLASYILPSLIGLLAGIGHGVASHQQELPFSLAEQVIESVQGDRYFN